MQEPPQQTPQQTGQNLAKPPVRKRLGLGCGIVALVLIVIIVIAAISANRGSQASTNNSRSSQTGQTMQAPVTRAAQTYNVGQAATLDGWVVTVSNVKTSHGGQFSSLKSGDTFLEIDVTAKNQTGSTQPFSSLASFKLKDTTGQIYTEAVASDAPASPDGNVTNGNPLRGTLAYEVPASIKSFTLDFTPNVMSTDTATWNIPVK